MNRPLPELETPPRPGASDLRGAAVEAVRRGGWLPLAVFLLHLLLSRVLSVYESYPATDVPMHVAGGFAIAFFWDRALDAFVGRGVTAAPDRFLRAVVVFALAGTATVFWEFAEFTGDRLGYTQAQAGLADTMLDMALGLVGGILYLGLGPRRRAL